MVSLAVATQSKSLSTIKLSHMLHLWELGAQRHSVGFIPVLCYSVRSLNQFCVDSLIIDTGSSNTWIGAGKAFVMTESSFQTQDKVVSRLPKSQILSIIEIDWNLRVLRMGQAPLMGPSFSIRSLSAPLL